jgi:hypothetical protein
MLPVQQIKLLYWGAALWLDFLKDVNYQQNFIREARGR